MRPAICCVFLYILVSFQSLAAPPSATPNQRLWQAVHEQDLNALKAALAAGAYIDARRPLTAAERERLSKERQQQISTDTPLIKACQLGAEDVVLFLLSQGANVHARGDRHLPAIAAAASGGNEKIFQALSKRGAAMPGPTRPAPAGAAPTLLDFAVYGGNTAIVESLLAQGYAWPSEITAQTRLLLIAVQKEHAKADMFLYLRNKGYGGADLTQSLRTKLLRTALRARADEVVRVLLTAPALADAATRTSLLHDALRYDLVQSIEKITQEIPDTQRKAALHKAVQTAEIRSNAMLDWLRRQGLGKDISKRTYRLLESTIETGRLSALQQLAHKIFGNQAPAAEWLGLALSHALRQQQTPMIDWVLSHNHVDVNPGVPASHRPLWLAAQRKDQTLVKRLLALGAQAQLVDDSTSRSLLHALCDWDWVAPAESLIQAGADPAKALIDCVLKKDNDAYLKVLLKHGLDPNSELATTGHSSQPIVVVAIGRQANKVAKILIASGAQLEGAALQTALEHNAEILAWLVDRQGPQLLERSIPAGYEEYRLMDLMAYSGDLRLLTILQRHNVDLQAFPAARRTAMVCAWFTGEGAADVAKLMEIWQADVNTQCEGIPLIALAVAHNQMAQVQYLVSQQAEIDALVRRDLYPNWTPLMIAVDERNQAMVQYLATAGADVNGPVHQQPIEDGIARMQRRSTGNTPLNLAVQKDDLEMASLLIDLGADIDHPSQDGFTPIMTAATNGHLQAGIFLLSHGADSQLSNAYNDSAYTIASAKAHTAFMRLLQDRAGAAEKGRALINAAREASLASVTELLQHKDLPKKALQGALLAVVQAGNHMILNRDLPISDETARKRINILRRLLEQGAVPDTPSHPHAPLHVLTANKFQSDVNLEFIALLLKAGANINRLDKRGDTPLHKAGAAGRCGIVQALLANGADPGIRNGDDELALTLFANQRAWSAQCVHAFTKAGADLNAGGERKRTALWHLARYAGDDQALATARLLIAANAQADLADENGVTPLMNALESEDGIGFVDLLLQHGARVNAKDVDGITPLMIAAGGHGDQRVRRLLAKGADPCIKDKQGKTALYYADEQAVKSILGKRGAACR